MTLRDAIAKEIYADWHGKRKGLPNPDDDIWTHEAETVKLHYRRDADAAILALRQWLADEGLVCVPCWAIMPEAGCAKALPIPSAHAGSHPRKQKT